MLKECQWPARLAVWDDGPRLRQGRALSFQLPQRRGTAWWHGPSHAGCSALSEHNFLFIQRKYQGTKPGERVGTAGTREKRPAWARWKHSTSLLGVRAASPPQRRAGGRGSLRDSLPHLVAAHTAQSCNSLEINRGELKKKNLLWRKQ